MQHRDAPDLLSLLRWMDRRPEREVLAPEARSVTGLRLEKHGKACLVRHEERGVVSGYCALTPLDSGGSVLEGPLARDGHAELLRAALRDRRDGIFAFCAAANRPVRLALEDAGFHPMRTTDFYLLPRKAALPEPAWPPGLRVVRNPDFATFRSLYRSGDEAWSSRLSWSPETFQAHLAREDVVLLVLYRGRQAVGFAELELGETTNLAYLAVHPAERGARLGRLLLRAALDEAFAASAVQAVQARAHDHAAPASRLYLSCGFQMCRSVVTYLSGGLL